MRRLFGWFSKKRPFSWFTDIADRFDVPVWVVYAVAVAAGLLALGWMR